MTSTCSTRCLHATCTKTAYSNVEGSKKAVYCKQHGGDHMVDVLSKSCLHDDCTKKPPFNVEGTKTAAFCKQHAEDGMINVRTTRLLTHSRRVVPGRGVLNNVEISASATVNAVLLDDSMIHVRKRSRFTLDGNQRPYSLCHGPLKRGGVEPAGMSSRNDASHDLSSRTVSGEHTVDTVGTTANQPRHITSEVLPHFLGEHHSREAIKMEMELVVLP